MPVCRNCLTRCRAAAAPARGGHNKNKMKWADAELELQARKRVCVAIHSRRKKRIRMRLMADKKAGNQEILDTQAESAHIQAQGACCGKDAHIAVIYAHIHFAVLFFLPLAFGGLGTHTPQPISARLSPTKAPPRRRKSGSPCGSLRFRFAIPKARARNVFFQVRSLRPSSLQGQKRPSPD